MNDQPTRFRLAETILLALLLAWSVAAHSDAYRFEMVIFERPNAVSDDAGNDFPEPPDLTQSVGSLSGLGIGGRRLGGVAYTLKQKGVIVHEHLAWVQTPRGRSSKAWYRVGNGRLNGLVRVTRGRFLHVDADLFLRDTNTAQPVRAKLYRRMRSDELHYVDHPKLGIIIRADRVEPRGKPDSAETGAGEPKPAVPAGSQQPG